MVFIKILEVNMILTVLIYKHKARSFEDQKGKGYIDLPILLSEIYTNNTVELYRIISINTA